MHAYLFDKGKGGITHGGEDVEERNVQDRSFEASGVHVDCRRHSYAA